MYTDSEIKQLIEIDKQPFNCKILSMSGYVIEAGFKSRDEAHLFAYRNDLENYYLAEEK